MWKVKGDVAITREKAEYILEQQPLTAKDWTSSRTASPYQTLIYGKVKKANGSTGAQDWRGKG